MKNFGIEYENKSCTDNKNLAIMCPVCYQLVGTIKQKITTEIFLDKERISQFICILVHNELEKT